MVSDERERLLLAERHRIIKGAAEALARLEGERDAALAELERVRAVVRAYVDAHDNFFSKPRTDSDDCRYELNVAENRLWALVEEEGKP